MQEGNACRCRNAPQAGKRKADISAEVALVFGIVPPFAVKHLFHQGSGEKFQNNGHRTAAQRKKQEGIQFRPEKNQNQNHTEAIDRAERPVQESAVHEFFVPHRCVGDFCTPPQEGV